MSTNALHKRLISTDISVFSIHPGIIDTNISKNAEDTYGGRMLKVSKKLGMDFSLVDSDVCMTF